MEPFETLVKLDPLPTEFLVILSIYKSCLYFFYCLHHGNYFRSTKKSWY